MPEKLLTRSTGAISAHSFRHVESSRLLHCVQLSPETHFDSNDNNFNATGVGNDRTDTHDIAPAHWAHRSGVNCLTVDRFEGRYMLSGGADSSIFLWDLETTAFGREKTIHKPQARIDKGSSSHTFGITHVSFYPFDSFAFLTSSFDHTLKLYSTESFKVSASFDLESVIYSHAVSPIADHLLVACATQHPAIRLVDLRSGASTHALAGHQGAVLSTDWSPKDEHILASGGVDGTVRLWDIRRSSGSLGVLDLEDAIGVEGEDGLGKNARLRDRGKAHVGACNGVVWKDDGKFIVTAGHDERVRVWNTTVGADSLSHFGPIIRNSYTATLLPLLTPSTVSGNILLYPNEKEILMFDMFEGTLFKRLRSPSATIAQGSGSAGQRNIRARTTSLAWKSHDIAFYSAHSDGKIQEWRPRTEAEADLDKDEIEGIDDSEDNERKRKRQALDDVFRDLTKQRITFT